MLASITPLGERGRRMNWSITTAYHVAGSTAGGAAIGGLAGALGALSLDGVAIHARLAALAAALAAGLAYELARGAVPGPRRQVDERWLDRYRGWVYGLGFGAQLGAGVTTVVVSSAVYGVLAAAFLSGRADAGLAIGAGAGALRGATVLMGARVATPQRLIIFHERMRSLRRPVRGAALTAQLVLAGVTVLAAVA
jgi:hypothetical protein